MSASRLAWTARTGARGRVRTTVAGLVAVQWLAVLLIAAATPHDGLLFDDGAEGRAEWTGARLLADGDAVPGATGYALPLLLAPVSFAGPSMIDGLPFALLLNLLVLLPLVPPLLYALAARIGGAGFGLGAAALWVALPLLAIAYVEPYFRETFREAIRPDLAGLTLLAELPAAVCLLAAAVFAFRALDLRSPRDALACGVLAGIAAGFQPHALVCAAAPALAFLVARRWALLPYLAAGLAPGLAALALWRWQTLGSLEAGIPFDRAVLGENLRDLRDELWSLTLLGWAALAGAVGVARRSFAKAVYLAAWLGGLFFLEAGSAAESAQSGALVRLVLAALPALVVLLASLALLVPRFANRLVPAAGGAPLGRRAATVLVAGALVALVPGLVARPLDEPVVVRAAEGAPPVPVDESLAITVRGRRLTWSGDGPFVLTAAFRTSDDLVCEDGGSLDCRLRWSRITTTSEPHWEGEPTRGTWIYRVGALADADGDGEGAAVLLSPPAHG
jgi:hypothetical protein